MPIYEYKCPYCEGDKVEIISKMSETINPLCDKCKKSMKKIISPTGFIVNGYSYKNGYSKKES